MSRIDDLLEDYCPDGVKYRNLGTLGRRNKGTSITASRMKELARVPGPIRVFAGGQTIADVSEDAVPVKDVVSVPSIIVKSRGHIGFAYYEKPFTHKTELWSYTIDDPAVEQKFVYYYLLTQAVRLQEIARATSVKLPQLGVRDTDNLRIPVPPLPVQQEIVRILDEFTQLEAELEAELEARRQQYSYYRDSLFSGQQPSKTNQSQRVPMSGIGEFIRGRRFTKKDYIESGIPAIHYGQIYTDFGVSTEKTVCFVNGDLYGSLRYAEPGDVIIAAVGETVEDVGKAVAWLGEDRVAIHDDCFLFRSSLNPKFVSHWMASTTFHEQKDRYVARAKVKRLSARGLGRIAIPVLPMDEQLRIVDVLDRFETLVNDLNTGLPAELARRRKQYEYYRDKLLTFKEISK